MVLHTTNIQARGRKVYNALNSPPTALLLTISTVPLLPRISAATMKFLNFYLLTCLLLATQASSALVQNATVSAHSLK